MFGWLTSILTGKQTAKPSDRRRAAPATAARAKPKPAERFFDRLKEGLEPCPALSPEQEERVSEWVCRVVEHVEANPPEPPTVPALAPRIVEALKDPMIDAHRLSRLLEQDQAIAAKLLHVANSPAYKPASEITHLPGAVAYLGLNQVAQLAMGLATKALFDPDTRAQLAFDKPRWTRLFHHGMTTGLAASSLHARKYRHVSDQVFLGGLFHDVGKSVALRAITELHLSGSWNETDPVIADEVLHRLHAFPGSEFYDHWNLPQQIMDICAMHHQQEDQPQTSPEFHLICVASSLDTLRSGSLAERREADRELAQAAAALKLTDAELRAAQTEVRELGERVTLMFRS